MYRAKRYALGTYCFHHEWVQPAHGPLVARPNAPGHELGPLIQAASPTTSSSPQVLHAELQEANAMLVMAALAAQDGEATAQSTLRRQTELLTLVAHELRGPLTPIGNAATLLNHEGAGRALLTRLRLVIERQVAHMTRLVDDLLDASRVETARSKSYAPRSSWAGWSSRRWTSGGPP